MGSYSPIDVVDALAASEAAGTQSARSPEGRAVAAFSRFRQCLGSADAEAKAGVLVSQAILAARRITGAVSRMRMSSRGVRSGPSPSTNIGGLSWLNAST